MTVVDIEPLVAPGAVGGAGLLRTLRTTEYARLDDQGQVYLDYTGAGLHAASQVEEHLRLVQDEVLGNPHSASPTSAAATALVESARAAVLRHFGADDDEYTCIFTANATGAMRLVGEAYPFAPGGRYLLTADNHNSVNGIREFARAGGADVEYVPIDTPDLRISDATLDRRLRAGDAAAPKLLAYPAQSNFSGVKHPLAWIDSAHDRGWDVLLDCAAFAPTSRLDLSSVQPDFVAVSFYKMFGYPTGIGGLIARREALGRLRRPWFSGGTVVAATVQGEVAIRHDGHAAFEDGTVDYLGIPAVEIGLRHLERVGIRTISGHVEDLGSWLLDELQALRHSDGSPATRIYGPRTWAHRGATIAFNFLHPGGRPVDERFVDRVAAAHGVSVRTGCFCNPGAGEAAFGISADRLAAAGLGHGATMDDYLLQVGLPTGGAIRASLGLASDEADVHRFLTFAADFRDLTGVPDDLPPREAC